MKKTLKRIVASLLVAVMLFGSAPLETLTGLDFGSLFEVEAEAAGEPTMEEMNPQHAKTVNILWPILPENNVGIKTFDITKYTLVTSPCYYRTLFGETKQHGGLDISTNNSTGHVVSSVANGVVSKIERQTNGGNVLYIKHEGLYKNGNKSTVYSCYAHLSGYCEGIKEGTKVLAGQPVAYSGNTGKTQGPHLHFSMYRQDTWPPTMINVNVSSGTKNGVPYEVGVFNYTYNYSNDPNVLEMYSKNQLTNATATALKTSKGNNAWMRSEPYDKDNRIIEVPKGETVTVIGWLLNDTKSKNKWYRVSYDGQEGWMYEKWLKINEQEPIVNLAYYVKYSPSNGSYKKRLETLDGYEKYNQTDTSKNDGICIRGTISAPGHTIKEVKVSIYKTVVNQYGYQCEFPAVCEGVKNPKSSSVTLEAGDAIDQKMTFKSLKPGTYTYSVTIKLDDEKYYKVVEDGVFSVYDESTNVAVKQSNKKEADNLSANYLVAYADNSFQPVLIKRTTNIVEPPLIMRDDGVIVGGNNGSGTGGSSGGGSTTAPAPTPAVKVYYPGRYRTTTADNLNIRTGPGSSYAKATSAIPKGTEIGITEVSSNGWGKTVYNGVTGWVALNYCTYVKAFAEIQKPGTVTVTYNSDKDFAAGSVVNASWNAINYADAYNAYLKKNDGTVVKTQTDIRGTSTYFTVDEAGTYYITVAATNSQHVGDESAPTATFTAHAPCTVTFVDWNGRTETRTVKYGEAAKPPRTPAREGHTFTGWSKAFDHVTSDITVEAKYERKSYTVKFVKPHVEGGIVDKSKEVVLDTVSVLYGDAATPPANTQTPNGYTFFGWSNDDYLCVKENLIVEAVYQWENADLPVIVSNVTATRISGGYTVGFNLSCTKDSVITGRVIVALKTAEGKPVVTTESAAFSLASGTTNKPMEPIYIPSENPASIAVVYVVESFGTAIPLSKAISASVIMNDSWSAWSFEQWPDNTWEDYQTRMVYRYKTKTTTVANTKNMPGWTMYYSEADSVSDVTYDPVTPINTDARTLTYYTSSEPIKSTYYMYRHYTNGGYNVNSKKNVTWDCAPDYGTDSGYGPTNIGPHTIESATRLTAQTSNTWNINKYYYDCKESVSSPRYSGKVECANTWFYSETPIQKVTGYRTLYHYTDTYYTYYFEKWSDWSPWTTNVHTASSDKKVETDTQYRYKNETLGVEDTSGVARIASTVSIGLTENDILLPNLKDYAGKGVILYIYKYSEASDWTGEYIGQQVIDADGNYSFNFKLREEPSAKTGNFVVSIGIEGCNNTIKIGEIIAPKPEYKVVFKYKNPSDNMSEYITLDEQIIKEGDAAVAPEHVEFEGYRFNGWLTDLSYITEDTHFVQYGSETEEKIITFEADYDPEEYVVVFVDWDNDSLVMKRYNYGDNIVAPIIKTAEGHQALWEGLDMENPVVTGDTVITAKHTKKTYEVNFYNYDGEIIDTQTVEYGSTASDVEIGEKDNYIFVDWEYTEDLFENSIVEGDTIYAGEPVVNFYPVYVFDESVEDPVSSLENGTYSEAQTVELTTATEGAVIYYTLDGTDPKYAINDIDQAEKVFEYTGPITLNRSVTLKYYACAFEKNDSEVMTNYYAINAGQTESEWMLYEDLPEYVTENADEYEIESAEGYRYKETITSSNYSDIANYEAQGWENTGFELGAWSDWLMEEPNLSGLAYESETMEPEPELEVRYQYTRYKYLNASGVYAYSPTEVSGVECELETLQLETKLATAGYVSGTTTKYYSYNGEKWFNYELAEVEVVPDYLMFRYRLKEYTLKKWGAWTLDAPVEGETRESESGTVYKYLIPEMCLVTIDPQYSDFGAETLYYIIEVNEYLTIDEADYTYEGYDFLGFYTDSGFTKYFNHKTTPVSGEMTLYPKYKAHEFAVIFVDYDGTVLLEETVEYGQCAGAFEFDELNRDGYVFIGWDYEGLDFITEDVIATAQYVDEDEYCTVSLNYGKYNMMAGNSFQLIATVTPEDTENPNLIWYSTDETVVTVTDEGFVTAVGEGTASIVVETEATGMIDECVITVSSNPSESLCLTYSSTLTLDKENYLLRGVTNSVWTASSIKQEFMNEEADMQIVDINGNTLADDAFVGTGSVIKFMNGETVLDEVNIVVTGDMNGDGAVNNRDAAMITRYLVDKETADFCQMVAIDVNGDGFVNNRDASMVSRYLVGKETL